jgi:hypothetical protein
MSASGACSSPAVRVRPWNEKEAPMVAGTSSDPVFLGDGNFASSSRGSTAQGAIREVVGEYQD